MIGKTRTIGTSAASCSTTGSNLGSITSSQLTALNYLRKRLEETGPQSEPKRTGATGSTQCSKMIAPGFERLMSKLTAKNRRRLAALYHYFVLPANQYGPAMAIRESKLNTWLGPDLRWGHLEWRQRNPYMDNEQMLQAMVIIYNKQQACTHYEARMIFDKTEEGAVTQLRIE